MNKRYQKYAAQQRELNKDKLCEWCNKEHDHTYGTGRFCSESCYKSFIASKNKGSAKCKAHLDELREKRIIQPNAPYGTWTCKICGEVFETRALLSAHMMSQHRVKHANRQKDKFICPYCSKVFNNSRALGGHTRSCKLHPLKAMHDEAYKRGGKTYVQNLKSGKISIKCNNMDRDKWCGYFNGMYFEYSYELAWVVYNIEHEIKFKRCEQSFEYFDSTQHKWRTYFPDFELEDGTIVEIKGWCKPNVLDKMQAVMYDYHTNIVLLERKDLDIQIEYCEKKYGKDFMFKLNKKPLTPPVEKPDNPQSQD